MVSEQNDGPPAELESGPASEDGVPTLLPNLIQGAISPDEMLDAIVAELHETDEIKADLCLMIGCGDLESLLSRHERELWPRVEQLARTDSRFRLALRSVWAYSSPMIDRREALLAELE